VLPWAVYEADKTHARSSAPDHGYHAAVKDRKNSKRGHHHGVLADRAAVNLIEAEIPVGEVA
jgi:hypothetical protein